MSLDVYVMPLSQFKSGDVQTGLQRVFGGWTGVIKPLSFFSPARIKRSLNRERGQTAVNMILSEAGSILGIPLHWPDKGKIVFAEQASWGFQAFRAYAKWLDLQDLLPSFDDPPENNYFKHPAMLWKDAPRKFRFSHIIDHCCYTGYYVPCRFDSVIHVEPYTSWGNRVLHHSFGSSYTLAEQLELLGAHLPSRSAVSGPAHELIHGGFNFLSNTASKSIKHQLPIIFFG